MGKVVGFGDPENLKSNINFRDDALKFASSDLQERSKIAEKYDEPELARELSNLAPVFCEDFETVDKARHCELHGWMLDVVGDWFWDQIKVPDPKTYALFEAFYGLTTRFELQWFLGTPLTKGVLNLDNYAELWKAGADYAVKDGELLVGSRRPLVSSK